MSTPAAALKRPNWVVFNWRGEPRFFYEKSEVDAFQKHFGRTKTRPDGWRKTKPKVVRAKLIERANRLESTEADELPRRHPVRLVFADQFPGSLFACPEF